MHLTLDQVPIYTRSIYNGSIYIFALVIIIIIRNITETTTRDSTYIYSHSFFFLFLLLPSSSFFLLFSQLAGVASPLANRKTSYPRRIFHPNYTQRSQMVWLKRSSITGQSTAESRTFCRIPESIVDI